jgi:hypothetical protein
MHHARGHFLTQRKAGMCPQRIRFYQIDYLCKGAPMDEWHPISTAPFDRNLQLSVIEREEVYPLVFPCRRTDSGWVHASTREPVFVNPSHWREWPDEGSS